MALANSGTTLARRSARPHLKLVDRLPDDQGGSSVELIDDLERRFVEGDEAALAQVYEDHGSLIYSYCRRQLGPETGRDVTQEIFTSAWRARHRFDPDRGSIRAWLMGIAKNRVVDQYRMQSRRPQIADGVEVADRQDNGSDRIQIDRVGDRMILANALNELNDRARTVVELSFFHQLTHPEIAAQTGLPLGTVKSDIRRSLQKLKHHLEAQS